MESSVSLFLIEPSFQVYSLFSTLTVINPHDVWWYNALQWPLLSYFSVCLFVLFSITLPALVI